MNDERVNVAVDKDTKLKADFVLRTQGKTLSKAVREMLEKYAKEFEEMNK